MTSEQTQQMLNQAQLYQQQMQGLLLQRESLNMQMLEVKRALEELEKTEQTEVYKASGPILIKTTKEEVKKELAEKQELINLRLKTLEKGEKKIKERFEEIRGKLSKVVTVKPGEEE